MSYFTRLKIYLYNFDTLFKIKYTFVCVTKNMKCTYYEFYTYTFNIYYYETLFHVVFLRYKMFVI